MPSLSVIIPTHRRPQILSRTLQALAMQTIASDLEVIVVSDVPDDEDTRRVISAPRALAIRHIDIPPCHQGTARNRGTAAASAPHILLIGDDIILHPRACEEHRALHAQDATSGESGQKAILGHITWDPACGITPVMRWLEESGWQFGYPALERLRGTQQTLTIPRAIQHQYTYASHISLPRELALAHPFRTDVHLYGWEDIEWGMRLRDAGVPLVYAPAARALHHHHIEMEDSLRRMQTLGQAARDIANKVPDFDRVPRGWKFLAYRICALFPTMAGRHRRAFLGWL